MRKEIKWLQRYSNNNLTLSVYKTKEVVVDYRERQTDHTLQ